MSRELIAYDPLTCIAQYHDYDPYTDTSTFISVGDATPVLEQNKRLANDREFSKKGIKDEFWKYASIPAIVEFKWLVEEGITLYKRDHLHRISKKLEDPQYRDLKCTTKKHIIIAHD